MKTTVISTIAEATCLVLLFACTAAFCHLAATAYTAGDIPRPLAAACCTAGIANFLVIISAAIDAHR